MKTLIVSNLSVFTLPLIIFFRILNFKILFISIEKYFRSKTLLNYLSLVNIKWFNHQEYKINHLFIELFQKGIPFSDILSTNISNKFWNSYLYEIYENKYCLNTCLNRRIFFQSRKIIETRKPKKTKTGQYATSEEILTKLVKKHDIIQPILDFRSLRKLKSTYVDALPELVNLETKHIHT